MVLTFDGKGVVLHREDLRDATRQAAERRRRQRDQLSPFNRLKPGEKEALEADGDGGPRLHGRAVRTERAGVPTELDAPTAGGQNREEQDPGGSAPPGGETALGAPRTGAGGGDRRGDAGSRAPRPRALQHWVVLVDGVETQLDLVEASAAEFGVEVTVILEIIHVVEYMSKAAHVFHREGSPELAHWAWPRVRSILEGKATRVAASMRRAPTVAGFSRDTRKPVDTCADYLLKYAPYLHYDRYLAVGYPIATGVIEGACRYLVRDRMELTGARWRLVAAEAVLKLRSLRASGDFDEYWNFHEARGYERNQRPAIQWQNSPAGHRAASTALLVPPSTDQVDLAMLLAEAHRPVSTTDEQEPHPSGYGRPNVDAGHRLT